ncbi:decapping and exoribonuclease protein-like [Watersipora subatra]|uniref:decapping and exoribonuclease protein-like n=1 Tax=Watersipora subatra TaxID=2589382 RepID=UPI00355BEACB
MLNVWQGENIDILLQSLLHHDLVGKATFVCKKKVLLVIATHSPDACRGIGVVKLQNSYYLYLYPTEKFPAHGYHGLRFEQLLTTTKTCRSKGIDQNKEFGALCKVNLGGHDLIVSGELDCLDGENRVKLKTCKEGFKTARHGLLLKWWLQCCFLNIETIYLGITETDGAGKGKYVDAIEKQSLTDLKQLVDKKTDKTGRCLARLKVFLDLLKVHATKEGQVYLIKHKSGTKNYTIERSDAGKDFISARLRNELITRSTYKTMSDQSD